MLRVIVLASSAAYCMANIGPSMLHQLISYSSIINTQIDIFNVSFNITKIAEKLLNDSKTECGSLNLSSHKCYQDCIYYLHPLTLITNMSDTARIDQMLYWYSCGGSPVGYYEIGNPDMCQYFNGTYCYTPLNAPNSTLLMTHGCCVPGL